MRSVSASRTTPLHDEHLAAGARMVEFAGYDMPVQYTSVIAEAQAVRNGIGLFDVSHMARLILKGDRVLEYLEWITSNDVSKLEDGVGQYSLLPNANGGVVDDIIVYRISPSEYRMVVNASNHDKDVAHMKEQNTFGVEMQDVTDETAMIAVQGPQAVEMLAGISGNPEAIKSAPLFGATETTIAGIDCFAARSGYTGEDGYELICSAADAPALWRALVEKGGVPCGLGSRDTLRVEAGLPLYGHELNDELSPMTAGLGWVIGKTKEFLGSAHINKVREEGASLKLMGVKLDSKRLPQIGQKVFVDDKEVGEVSSGVYSPVLECGIAFAFLDPAVKAGQPCELEIRGKREAGVITTKRFLKKS